MAVGAGHNGANADERADDVIIYLPDGNEGRRCLMVQKVEACPAPGAPPISRKMALCAWTSAGPVEIVLSAGEAAMLMFDIGHALEQTSRLAQEVATEALR